MEKKEIIKVKDLIEELKKFDENLDIAIEYPVEGTKVVQLSYVKDIQKTVTDDIRPIYQIVIRAE